MREWMSLFENTIEVIGTTYDEPTADFISSLRDIDMTNVELRVAQRGEQRVKINWIKSPNPDQGNGSRILNAVCDLADQFGVQLYLEPFADDAATKKFLVSWYRRFGFRLAKDGLMHRAPVR